MNLVPALYSMIVTYTAVSIVGVMHGPFILLAMLCWTQYLLNQPLASCFRPSENRTCRFIVAIAGFVMNS